MHKRVLYKGEVLTLMRFWFTNEPCLWINHPHQIDIPKMEFVGGHPDEYCIFLKNLSMEEKKLITDLDGSALDLEHLLEENP